MNLTLQNIANRRREIILFLRDEKGKQEIKYINDFFPFFYECDIKGKYKGYDGTPLKRVFASEPADVVHMRSPTSYSADIKFCTNFLIHRVKTILPSRTKYCLDPQTLIRTNYGVEFLENIKIGDELKSLDQRRHLFTNKVKTITKSKKECFLVKTKNGQIKSGLDHKFYCIEESKNKTSFKYLPNFYYKELEKFKKGDYLIILKNFQSIPSKIIFVEWFWLLGYLLGDGARQKNKNLDCDITERDYSLIKKILSILNNYHINYSLKKKETYYFLKIKDNDFKDLINNLLIKRDINFLENVPINYKLSFIGGFFDAEGSVSFTKAKNVIITNTNKKIIYYISSILWSIGINNSICEFKQKKGKLLCYHLNILDNEKFKEIIDINSAIKIKKLLKLNKKYDTDILPIKKYIKKLIILSGYKNSDFLKNLKGELLHRKEALEILLKLKNKSSRITFKKLYQRLLFIIEHCYFSKIKNIKFIGRKKLIDISLEGKNGNFIANNFHTHNCFLDIEIQVDEIPDVRNAKYPISSISLYNSFTKNIQTFFLLDYATEKEMIEAFITYIQKERFDLWISWNSSFDYDYMYYHVKDFAKRISPINSARMGENRDIFYPAGLSIIDFLKWFRKIYMREASYALDYIGQKHLNRGKKYKDVDFSKVNETVKLRNRDDVFMLVELENKYNIISYYDELRRLSKVTWEDLIYNSRIVESILFDEAIKENIVLPNKQRNFGNNEEATFQGAIRDIEKSGFYKDISECDINSAYPQMIVNFNLDSSNIRAKMINSTIKINNLYFEQNENTLLPRTVKRILIAKNKFKELKNNNPDNKQIAITYEAIKAIANSSFGIFGNSYFRLYNPDIASSITFLVRDLLLYVKDRIEKEKLRVVYFDTDAIFYNSKEDISNKLNQFIREWAKEKYNKDNIDLIFEYKGYFTKLFILEKCHYYGYKFGKTEPEIKGVEIKRSSSSKYEAKFQEELLNKILNEENREIVLEWLSKERERIKTLSLLEIGFPCKIASGKDYKAEPIFLRAYNNSMILFKDLKIRKGELFYYTFIKSLGYDKNHKEIDVIAFTENTKIDTNRIKIDYDKIIDRCIIYKTQKIFNALDWHLERNIEQLSLI